MGRLVEKYNLPYKEKLSLLSHYEKSRPFNIERFLDVSKLNGGLIPTLGMPLLQATYISGRSSTAYPLILQPWTDAYIQGMV